MEVREKLFTVYKSPDVDASWLLWSREAEASLARAYISAGGLLPPPFRILVVMWVEANFPSVPCDWEVGVTIVSIMLIVPMSLMSPPVLRFRRSFVSVCNVLKGIKLHGFSEARVTALWYRWRAVVRMGPTGPVTSFEPWTHWIPPDLHGFYKWTMDTLALLNEFVLKVVHHRQTARLQAWSNWNREDLTSHPYQWLRPEFVPPAPYLVCKPQDSPNGSGFWSSQLLLMTTFERHGCLIFVEMGTLLLPLKPFLILLGITFRRKPFWIFPYLLVRSFMKLPWPRNPPLPVLMDGLGMRLKFFLYLGLSVLP